MGDGAPLIPEIDHGFSDPDLLRVALTHRSAAKGKDALSGGNERLEFLGDRVLGLVVADMLYTRFGREREGAMAKRFVALVRRETLARVAVQIHLGDHIQMAKGERAAGADTNPAILSDCMEAVIAALYLDGGLEPARSFIEKLWTPLLDEDNKPPQDAKTQLQEWLQGRGKPLPKYEMVGREGPAHAPVFTIELTTSDGDSVSAEGKSKREAEQIAAQLMLDKLSYE
ncbi:MULTISPECIES: ribonuclease III [Thalassospira]|jgi:ribonuclease-3|uniref:Ribonuclease 3 n=2 Tax=Thalassospira TaxID=168934 RepID=A0A358HQZ1_9PROT|nr:MULTISPECIES: ribonuclease III [Thalassospira]PKR59527.1 ribonuclease III [Thalassospira lohafexi]RCK26322.1 ribonuclease [Thalassospira lucentensis MCCC 1A00383 = DSM 14000]HBU97618.1 ribonuclease III [Thalassospira lucentensis]HCW69257.1 ribonuclease III [Thalassospira lucentensis]|tara:strand:+ start:1527 stop:2210 length:684 start_codon:yes stop_codon:yes gene_type:complete